MNANCKLCGAPLKKGNIKVVRKKGKRPYRVCRKCPEVHITSTPIACQQCPDKGKCSEQVQGRGKCLRIPSWKNPPISLKGTAATGPQARHDSTGGPITVAAVFQTQEPPRFRYFMTRDQAERVKAAIERNVAYGLGVGFEVIPVPEDQVEAEPDRFDSLVEVTVSWKVGE